MKKQREMAAFKARPATVVKVKPFEPKKQNKPLIGKLWFSYKVTVDSSARQ